MELNNLNSNSGGGSSKKTFFVIFVLVIAFVIFAFAYSANRTARQQAKLAEDMDLSFLNTSTTIESPETVVTTIGATEKLVTSTISSLKKATTKKTVTTKKTTITPTTLSATSAYLKAANIYKTSGYYFQFVNCHGTPGSLVIKKGAKFMMDNRDNKIRKIAVMGKTYSLNAYNYTIVTADKVGKHYITCDGGGAAQITVAP